MNERENVTKAKAIFARTCIVLTGLVLATGGVLAWMNARSEAPAAGQDPYDYETSIAKLKKIGQALQIYRAEYGFKPVAERKTYSDAGLPPSFDALAEPGHAWSLPEGMEDLRLPGQRLPAEFAISFWSLYWQYETDYPGPSQNDLYRSRGEQLIVLGDCNPVVGTPRGSRSEIVVLRLDGTVDVLTYDKSDPRAFLRR